MLPIFTLASHSSSLVVQSVVYPELINFNFFHLNFTFSPHLFPRDGLAHLESVGLRIVGCKKSIMMQLQYGYEIAGNLTVTVSSSLRRSQEKTGLAESVRYCT